MDDGERAARLAEIASEILMVERAEESVIEQAETTGQKIARRPDVDLRALLSLSNDMPVEATS